MRMCAHTWKRWLLALLITHRWLFTTEKTESDRKWCSPCVVTESAPWTVLRTRHCTDGAPSWARPYSSCPALVTQSKVWSALRLEVRPCQAPGERPRPALESSSYLVQLPSSLSLWWTVPPIAGLHILLHCNAKLEQWVGNDHTQLVVSHKGFYFILLYYVKLKLVKSELLFFCWL